MSETVIPNRVSWVAEGRRAHGYLIVADDALHLICLKDESETAGAVGNATARQFGLVGALVGAGVSAAREASRKKELNELYQAQQQAPLGQRSTQHRLSRVIRKADVTSLQTAAHLTPTLVLSSGRLVVQPEGSTAGAVIEQWAGAQSVKVEIVQPPKFPWKVIGVVLLIPVALVVLHLLVSVPYAIKRNANQHRAVEVREAFVAQAEKGHAAIRGPTGEPFMKRCASKLVGVSPEDVMTYVGELPANAKAMAKADYEGFPQLAYVDDVAKVESNPVEDRWAKRSSFGDSYLRVAESPLDWGRVANRIYSLPARAPTHSMVAKVNRVDLSAGSKASMTVALLDAKGAELCRGDLTLLAPPDGRASSVGVGFQLAQGLPAGLYLPFCTSTTGVWHDPGYSAALVP